MGVYQDLVFLFYDAKYDYLVRHCNLFQNGVFYGIVSSSIIWHNVIILTSIFFSMDLSRNDKDGSNVSTAVGLITPITNKKYPAAHMFTIPTNI